jgi:hypothetical protein
MEIWQTILLALGGNAVLLAVLGWLSKSFVSQLLAKDIEAFKYNLKSESEAELQKLKYDIEKSVIEYQQKISRLHEKRAEVIAETYGALAQCYRDMNALIFPYGSIAWEKHEKDFENAMDSVHAFFSLFNKYRIYLPEELCSKIDKFVMDLRSNAITFHENLKREERLTRDGAENDELRDRIDKAVRSVREFMDVESRSTKTSLEKELRTLMEETRDIS